LDNIQIEIFSSIDFFFPRRENWIELVERPHHVEHTDSRSPFVTSFYFFTKVSISKYYSRKKFSILFIEFKYQNSITFNCVDRAMSRSRGMQKD